MTTTTPTATHTPGPWQVSCETADLSIVALVRDQEIAVAIACQDFPLPVTHANARLIAAAPAMRALLVNLLVADTLTDAGQDDIRALLASIDGQPEPRS